MSDFVIETRGLTRYFKEKCVVNSLDLRVPRGSIFGFLGRNGAGKSTTIRMLLGLLEPTRGDAYVLGYNSRSLPPEARARIGYLAEGHHVYGWMTVAECGSFQASFYPQWNQEIFDGVVDHFHLDGRAKAGDLSRGQRAGLCLAMTMAPEPELLILDDPALGLDPVARRSLLQSMIYVTRREDRTILFSSHLLAEVERVADHVAVLDYGVLRANAPLDVFRQRVRQVVMRFDGRTPELPPLPGLLQAFRTQGEISLTVANYDQSSEAILRSLNPHSVEEIPLSLEDAFISYLGERGEKSFFLSGADAANPPDQIAEVENTQDSANSETTGMETTDKGITP